MDKIKVFHNRFVDNMGRHVILSGINLVYKGEEVNGKMNYYAPWNETDFQLFQEWGFNVIRLGLIWDAVEPEPGVYNQEYLDWIGSMLDLCEKYSIHAFLDMHQDLYSVLYSDGAPKWATITDGEPHSEGDLWSDAYLFSEAVKRSFDHFWANSPAPDGKGLQDHYADMWLHIATQFANHPALLGYDFLNEPYPGTASSEIFAVLMSSFAELINSKTGTDHTLAEMIEIFSVPQKKLTALELLKDEDLYHTLAKSGESLVAQFDLGPLSEFYNKITQVVRTVDSTGIIMREHCYFSNMGIQSKAKPILAEPGRVEPNQAYSPHGYDLVIDTDAIVQASNKRADVIFAAQRRTQQNMGVPVIVGEWGGHGHFKEGLDHIEHLLAIFAENLWSNTYWCYDSNFKDAPVLQTLKRPYPQAVCGEILSYKFDRKTHIFSMEWEESEWGAPSLVYIPKKEFTIELAGKYEVKTESESALLTIPPWGGKRTLRIGL